MTSFNDPRLEAASRQDEAASRALASFAAVLAAETRALEFPDDDELARAVDGRLDVGERALWEERIARDPALAGRQLALAEFVVAAYGSPARESGTLLRFERRAAGARPAVGWLAAAAAALGAVGLAYVLARPVPVRPSEALREPAPPSAPELLFEDGFEAGVVDSWSSITSPG